MNHHVAFNNPHIDPVYTLQNKYMTHMLVNVLKCIIYVWRGFWILGVKHKILTPPSFYIMRVSKLGPRIKRATGGGGGGGILQ